MAAFIPIADGVHLRRFSILDVNSVLITGNERALLVDTLSTSDQGRDLAAAVRDVTDLPVDIVNTHRHFDHVLGNDTVARALNVTDIWGHRDTVEHWQRAAAIAEAVAQCREIAPTIADGVAASRPRVPNRIVERTTTIDLGGRRVVLHPCPPAHSDGDIVVIVDDVFIAGDLVEQGADPDTTGSDLRGWVAVMDELLPQMGAVVVPGHGSPVDRAFVARQRNWIQQRIDETK